MDTYSKRLKISEAVAAHRALGHRIGFVPTMGALHSGHLSLVDFALNHCDTVVVSIFVNPTQFDNPKDLETYPRDLPKDLLFLSSYAEKVLVFAPSIFEIYGNDVKSRSYDFEGLASVMEGAHRHGHFEGVATVLSHLFSIIKPDIALFGEKDFQQLQIVKKMVEIECISVEIIGVPISRNADGLAESSRNQRLSAAHREAAPFIYRILLKIKEDFDKKGLKELKIWAEKEFEEHKALNLEYVEIAKVTDLKTAIKREDGERYRVFVAVFAGDVRLIDSLALN